MLKVRGWLVCSVGVGALLLSGCATTAKYEEKLNSWLGQSEDSLVEAWGPPQSSYPLSGGMKVIEYDRDASFQTGGYTYTTPVTTYNTGSVNVFGSGGSAMGTYNGMSTTYVQHQAPIQTFHTSCHTRFTIRSDGIITHWSFEGNGCRSK